MADHLLLPYLAHGHVNPMLSVAAELVRRGERVDVAVSADFAGQAGAVGAGVLPVPGHEVRVPAGRRVSTLRVLTARWCTWMTATRLVREYLLARRPDAVLADARLPWAGSVVRRAETPLVSLSTTHGRVGRGGSSVLVNALPELQSRRHGSDRTRFVAPLVLPAGPEEELAPLLRWISDGPMLLVAPGTVFDRVPAFFHCVAAEFAGSRWRVLMATGRTHPDQLGPLPPNVLARAWLPQRGLLRYAAVLLGHGGMNSVQEALLAGVPMMLAPRSREQAHTTRRLVELGAAVRATGALRERVEWLASDVRVHTACSALRARLVAAPGAAFAADVLMESARPDVLERSHWAIRSR